MSAIPVSVHDNIKPDAPQPIRLVVFVGFFHPAHGALRAGSSKLFKDRRSLIIYGNALFCIVQHNESLEWVRLKVLALIRAVEDRPARKFTRTLGNREGPFCPFWNARSTGKRSLRGSRLVFLAGTKHPDRDGLGKTPKFRVAIGKAIERFVDELGKIPKGHPGGKVPGCNDDSSLFSDGGHYEHSLKKRAGWPRRFPNRQLQVAGLVVAYPGQGRRRDWWMEGRNHVQGKNLRVPIGACQKIRFS
jgi:hypothetical protein